MIYEVKDDKLIFNVSKGKTNYCQREAKFTWQHPKNPSIKMDGHSMCNTVSIVMALDYAGWHFPTGPFEQPEDNLTHFMFNDARVMEHYRKTMPAMAAAFDRGDNGAMAPNLIHATLAHAANLWLESSTAVQFSDRRPISDIIREVVMFNRPVVMSGRFPFTWANGTRGHLGHINVLVGVIYDIANIDPKALFTSNGINNLMSTTPEAFIFDDPYGDWNQNFKRGTGNDCVAPFAQFTELWRPERDVMIKWGHFVKPGAAIV